jgi:FixJ family two-component response regulator
MYSAYAAPSSPGPPKVLLVEDDTAVRRSLQLVLQARGFDVKAFADPELLLRDGAADSAACLVADYQLQPSCNGLELLSALRRNAWTGPAILITAYPSAALTQEAALHGYATVLAKPFRDRELADTVARLVGPERPDED